MSDRSHDRDYAADRRRNKGDSTRRPRQGLQDSNKPTAGKEELAVLVGVGPETPPDAGGLPMLDELAELTRTAGAQILGRLWQKRQRPHPSSYLGTGKIDELKELCEELCANVVIADTELSPAQVRSLEDALDLRVIDRSELIIDIFATHAKTRQSRLQVELAQLKYTAPRLRRMWTHLSRITGEGGIGSRGPGEKQIEVDRRIVQKRIRDLTRELKQIEERRGRQVKSRNQMFKVALVGYTNAGKSTLMKQLTGADVFVADQLFATLDTRTRKWQLESGLEVLLSDTVGFIDKLPHHLVASFHATLEEVREADLLLHVVDAGDPEITRRVEVVRSVLKELGAGDIPEHIVLNKVDVLPEPAEATILAHKLETNLLVSALRGTGMDNLTALIQERATLGFRVVDLDIPAKDGKTLALLAKVGRVLSENWVGEHCHVKASVPASALGDLKPYLVAASS